jgi:hypothetical protein
VKEALTPEPQDLRRRNYHNLASRLHGQMLKWRDEKPRYRIPVPNATTETPPMGELDYSSAWAWAYRITAADAEVSINMSNEAAGRAKQRAGIAL